MRALAAYERCVVLRRVASRSVVARCAASGAGTGKVLVIDSGSDYLWLHALLDRRPGT